MAAEMNRTEIVADLISKAKGAPNCGQDSILPCERLGFLLSLSGGDLNKAWEHAFFTNQDDLLDNIEIILSID